ncbi:ribose-5-phosphate isomerase [bacterium]|nr:ribose-5-phosphate isomerase [bacterium]|tara:strand:- start:228 stop:677 length:450 start_codon:yes stop_codon:yes gene_type:complete
MKVYLAADHRGFEMKTELLEWLESSGHEVTDLGPKKYVKSDDYPDYGFALGEKVASEPGSFGIGICGSGVGMVISANKVPGVRAGQARDPEIAAVGRSDDNTNILILSSDYIELADAKKVVEMWLATEFAGEDRFKRRIDKISSYEAGR